MIENKPTLITLKKIWSFCPHAALTDLIRFQNLWFCSFRESDKHVLGQDGAIRILASADGVHWDSIAYFQERGCDFRDPKLSITPDGRLMLLVGCTIYRDRKYVTMRSRVAFSISGQTFSPWSEVAEPHEWLWRVTWHDGVAWGISYRFFELETSRSTLWKSVDGIHFEKVCRLEVPGSPNEGTIRFLSDNKPLILLRRDGEGHDSAFIGTAPKPEGPWSWSDSGIHIGGPNFIEIPEKGLWAAGRLVRRGEGEFFENVALFQMDEKRVSSVHILPSGGEDTSYPGLVWHDEHLWMSYYSSHEGSTAIYFAKLKI